MQTTWLCIFWGSWSEETFENARWRNVTNATMSFLALFFRKSIVQWRKIKQMLPMWLWILARKSFEETFEITQSNIFSGRPFEDTFESAHSGEKSNKHNQWIMAKPCLVRLHRQRQLGLESLCIFSGRQFEDFALIDANVKSRKKTNDNVIKSNKCNQCLFSGRRFEETFENAQWRKMK